MSALKAQLTEDMKNAMRARESVKLTTIRFLLSEIKNFEIDNGEQDDAGVTKVIAKEVKKMKDAMNDFANAGRQDLVDEETVKVQIMESYLPAQLSAEELEVLVKEAIAEAGSSEFGVVMKAAMAKVQGRADGGAVSAMVKKLLS
jgi:uncharacterized protein